MPPDHEAFNALNWAAEAGVTAGYDDGTLKPDRSLSKRHAVVLMERFHDEAACSEVPDGGLDSGAVSVR